MRDLEARIERQRRALGEACGVPVERVRTVLAPYRVCPIGAHVDHQHGPVLALSISAWTLLCFAPSPGSECVVTSENFPGEARFDLGRVGKAPPRDEAGASSSPPPRSEAQPSEASADWRRYVFAAARVLAERLPARPRGIVARIEGSLPGGGLSSSASMLLALLSALAAANQLELAAQELVSLSRRAENDFVGVASGVLDPAAIVGARRGHLLAIDTARVLWEAIPLGADAPTCRILVAFTGTTRNLAATGFNQRVAECGEAARRLGELGGVAARRLGDVPDALFDRHLEELPLPLRKRVRHFVGERARVREGAECWRRGDLARFGRLMNESCQSSIANYETGSETQRRLQQILCAAPGVLGARFSGGGYGGCSIALVEAEAAESCRASSLRAFAAAFPALAERARFLLVDAEDGVRLR